ncbi:CPCC family cysteine-rich protein [Mangrovibacter phragmitis]|uniref:CPCC family cysteine-rich protein n=1 Tax=Mangrovibacter phragmitis TaxID=1691903 RepID=UPI000945979C|nr:CPCC family cysteine-rich protein [Mangrovibacter phragmitis]
MNSPVYLCPCCHKYEFSDIRNYENCPVCNWADDPVQEENPSYGGGANVMSLNDAPKAYTEGRTVK